MKTTKLFLMAALALTFAACSNDDNDAAQPAKAEGITITAKLAPKSDGAATRAVADKGDNKITVTWAENEHIAILYTVGSEKKAADATITSVDESGAATISFSVDDGTPDNTACTLVYPESAAKDDNSGVKDAATLLAAQNGTLNANLDVRVGAGTIQTTTPGLTVSTQPAAQFAIFKFTTQNGSADINVSALTVTIGEQAYVITPASATIELYAALPEVSSQTVSFTATGSDSKTYAFSKNNVSFTKGKYYQSTLQMTKQAAAPAAAEAVDLGLPSGTKWANMNVGATSVTDYGDYFAWGETEPFYSSQSPSVTWKTGKEAGYAWASYQWTTTTNGSSFTKYTGSDKTQLDLEDDAARANWGGSWRMPTEAEFNELLSNTNKTEYFGNNKYSGANGILLTSKTDNTKSIFLPAAGIRNGSSLGADGSNGYYWSSTLYSDFVRNGRNLFFYSDYADMYFGNRYYGFSVRPVQSN